MAANGIIEKAIGKKCQRKLPAYLMKASIKTQLAMACGIWQRRNNGASGGVASLQRQQ